MSYIYHFNVQNMRKTIKLTPLLCNLVPSLVYIRILSIHFLVNFRQIGDLQKSKKCLFSDQSNITYILEAIPLSVLRNDSFQKVNL